MVCRNVLKIIALCSLCALAAAGCGGKKQAQTGSIVDFPREKTMYLGGDQWGKPNTFNPLCDWPAWPIHGKTDLLYEPLMVFNSLTGEMEPLFAHSLEKTPEVISVVLDSRARWSDGVALTAEDVVFSYNIGKNYKNAPMNYGAVVDFISDVTVKKTPDSLTGGKTQAEKIHFVVNKKGRNNPLIVLDQLQAVRILPKHIIEPMLQKLGGDFTAFQKDKMDKGPVVSGRYNLESYSSEKIVLKRRDDYWGNAAMHGGKLPAPQYYIHPIYKSNDHFSVALQQGNLDVSMTFIPRIWMKEKDGVGPWYKKEPYFVPGCMPLMLMNFTRYPLSDKNFRRAMASAINYKEIKGSSRFPATLPNSSPA